MAQKLRPQENLLYGSPSPLTGQTPPPIKSQRAPTSEDTGYAIGQIWVDQPNGNFYGLASVSAGSASWSLMAAVAGEIATLTGDSGGAISPVAGNVNILGGDTIEVAGSGNTLTINSSAAGYPVTPYVVGPAGAAGYSTVQAAVNAANAAGGGVIFIQQGTYAENLTLYDNIYLQGEDDVNTIISGVHTPPDSGAVTCENLTLSSATSIFSSVAAGSTAISLVNCYCIVTNGFVFDLDNWTGDLGLFQCSSGGTDDGVVNNTGGSTLLFYQSVIGAGSGQSMVTSGTCDWDNLDISCPVDHQTGSVLDIFGCQIKASQTISNDSTGVITHCNYSTGASAAITMSSSAAIQVTTSVITSSANPSIAGAGAGTLSLGDVTFTSNSSLAGTLTVAWEATKTGPFIATGSSSLTTASAGDTISLGSASQTGAITLGLSTAGQTINMGSGINTGAQVVNIATGASGANSTVNVLSGNGTAGTQTMNILTGTRAGALNVATGAAAHVVAVGSASAGAITVDTAAGISLDAATASNFTVTGAGADLTLSSAGGSVSVTSSEAALANAVTISASAADSGITLDAGATPGVTFTNGTQSHRMLVGSGSPNGAVTALQGSLYVDVAGATSTTILYANTDGGTTWVGVGA